MNVKKSLTRVSFIVSKFCNRIFWLHFQNKKQSGAECPEQKVKLNKTKQQIELLTQVIHFLVVKNGVVGVIMPKAIFSYYKYFATDAGNGAFELAVAAWWVP